MKRQSDCPCADWSPTKAASPSATSTPSERSATDASPKWWYATKPTSAIATAPASLAVSTMVGSVSTLVSIASASETGSAERQAHRVAGLAGQEGLDPPTCGFGDRCSTNLSTCLARPTHSLMLLV